MGRRGPSPRAAAWDGDLPVFERTLTNGLKALALPRTGSPTVVCDLYYPAGSVDDPSGRAGLAHFVEHMLFKGTERFPKGQIDRLAFLAAGQANAATAEDFTHYWFAFPADRWELALPVEADRMAGADFDSEEVEAERGVILEERARELDSPSGRLDEAHLAFSYLVHPYRNPILGWPEDLRRIASDDLRAFHRTHYRPDGAVLVLVGDLDPSRALDRVEAHFGKLPRGQGSRPAPPPPEPKQNGRRDFRLEEDDATARGVLGWASVPTGHVDTPALDVLSDLLSCGRRSRLWDGLVERKRIATWVDASHEPSRLAGQFVAQVEAAPGVEPAEVEAAILEELAKVARDGPTEAELARSRNRLEASWRWEQEDGAGLASGLGQYGLWGDWRAWQAEHRAALAVSALDVSRVAAAYLIESGLTAGWSVPKGMTRAVGAEPSAVVLPFPSTSTGARVPAGTPAIAADPRTLPALAIPTSAARLVDYLPRRQVLPNGLRVVSERRAGTGVVALELECDAGVVREAKPGLANLVGRLREEGTERMSAEELAEAVEDIGGELDVFATGLTLKVRAEDIETAFNLLADLMIRPAFPADALAWTRRRILAETRADRDDPSYIANLRFNALVYGDHPYGREPRGSARGLASLSMEDVQAHHARHDVPENCILAVVGDYEPNRLRACLRRHLEPWEAAGRALPDPIEPARDLRPKVRRVERPGEQVKVVLGHLGIARDDPDYDALVVLDHILGRGPGFTDRLSRRLRDELGLTYSVGGAIADSADRLPGTLRIGFATAPESVERAVAEAVAQVRALALGDFGDDEVEEARRYLSGAWVFDYQTVSQRAARLLDLERLGLPLDEPLRWPERLAALDPAAVRSAAARHLQPDGLSMVLLGPLGKPRTSRPRGRSGH